MLKIEHPPLRYSVSQKDFDYEVGRRLRVMVDGVEQQQVIEYDCGAGTVVKNKLDEHGRLMLNAARDDRMCETVTGTVTVEWRD
jgi:hypothetical protein